MNRILQEKGGRVLAFGAHPDDLEVGAGGLLARLSDEGADVTLVIVSIPNHTEQRRAEAHAAADLIDANVFVLYEDRPCRVEDIPMHELVRRMDSVIGDVRPDLVITHSATRPRHGVCPETHRGDTPRRGVRPGRPTRASDIPHRPLSRFPGGTPASRSWAPGQRDSRTTMPS